MESDDHKSRLIRSTASVAVPTLVSRVLGYIRDLLQAYYLGTGNSADAFTIAFTIPNLFRRLTGEGAMTPAFVPTFTELKQNRGRTELWAFGNVFFWDLALLMAVTTGLGILLAPGLVKVIAYGRVHQHDGDPDGDGRPGVLEGEEGRGDDLDTGNEGQA